MIAYLLNPLLVSIEKKFKLKRIFSILIVYILMLCIIVLIITIFAPKIVVSFRNLLNEIPGFITATENMLDSNTVNIKLLDRLGITDYLQENFNNILDQLSSTLNPIINKTIVQVIDITSAITSTFVDFGLGVVISIYLLKDKEIFIKQAKRLVYAVCNTEKADNLINIGAESNIVFSKYLIGKLIDSLIIGVLCFIGTLILNTPYPLIISTIVFVTNMIPYFGPFIGMIPAVIITLFYSPIKAFWVFIFILALQQFDGLYLGPKILGTQVGVKPFWIISAIIIGGGLFGVMGMLLAVPIAAVIKTMLQKYVNTRLERKNIDI
ncbi:AI-2E family transporter [Brassicibacter mesophilus]|uniref:AI-2E family transporter n=1 Tax=Brassicibacter mesophilus TaxID=745119 RepID=UPI003D2124B3